MIKYNHMSNVNNQKITGLKNLVSQQKYVYLPNIIFYKSWRFYLYLILLTMSIINLPLAIGYDLSGAYSRRPITLLIAMSVIVSIYMIVGTVARRVKTRKWSRSDDMVKSPEKRILVGYPVSALVLLILNILGYIYIL